MNKDIRGLIYGYLTFEEKMKIRGIDDRVLDKQIIEEIENMWLYDHHSPVRHETLIKKIIGKTEDEVIWKVFMSDLGTCDITCSECLEKLGMKWNECHYGIGEGSWGMPFAPWNKRFKMELVEIRERIIKMNSQEEIVSKIRPRITVIKLI